jgi:hypothetical protein
VWFVGKGRRLLLMTKGRGERREHLGVDWRGILDIWDSDVGQGCRLCILV